MNWLKRLLMVFAVLIFSSPFLFAAETDTAVAETNSQETLRSYLQLQEQIHGTQLAIERNRKEAEAASAAIQIVTEKLSGIESSLSVQRSREWEAMQNSNRVMLIVAGTFAGIGLCAMLLMAYFQSRAVSRLAEIAASLPAMRPIQPAQIGFPAGDAAVAALSPAEQSSLRLLGAVERLEKRMHHLERGLASVPETAGTNGNGAHPSKENSPLAPLLSRGQELLDAGKADEALKCFDEAGRMDPASAEALVKKGSALEKLQRLDEAIECYDQAIAANGALTIAYLHKAGLCNRMERFSEALACYEKALQTQEKRAA